MYIYRQQLSQRHQVPLGNSILGADVKYHRTWHKPVRPCSDRPPKAETWYGGWLLGCRARIGPCDAAPCLEPPRSPRRPYLSSLATKASFFLLLRIPCIPRRTSVSSAAQSRDKLDTSHILDTRFRLFSRLTPAQHRKLANPANAAAESSPTAPPANGLPPPRGARPPRGSAHPPAADNHAPAPHARRRAMATRYRARPPPTPGAEHDMRIRRCRP